MENEVVIVIATSVTAIAASVAAIASWRSVQETRKVAQSQLINSLLDDYASDAMADAMAELRGRKTRYGRDYTAEFRKRRSEEPNWEHSRRRVAHYFQKVAAMYDKGLLDKKLARIVATKKQVKFYKEVIEPLEAVVDPDYGHSSFDVLESLYEK